MTDLLLAGASAIGLLMYAVGAVAVYRFEVTRTITAYQRVAGALACLLVYVTGIVLTASLVQMDGPRGHGGWMVVAAFGGGVLFIPLGVLTAFVSEDLEPAFTAGIILWPLALPLRALIKGVVRSVVFLSRGPLVLGTSLADVADRRANRRSLLAAHMAERGERIAALEKELGLREDPE